MRRAAERSPAFAFLGLSLTVASSTGPVRSGESPEVSTTAKKAIHCRKKDFWMLKPRQMTCAVNYQELRIWPRRHPLTDGRFRALVGVPPHYEDWRTDSTELRTEIVG